MTPDTRDKVKNLVRLFVSATQGFTIYGKDHNLTKTSIDEIHAALKDLFRELEEVTIGVVGNEIAFDKEPFYNISKNIPDFITHLKSMGIEKLTFLSGVKKDEIDGLIGIFAANLKLIKGPEEADDLIKAANLKNILVGRLGFTEEEGLDEIYQTAKKNIEEGMELLRGAAGNLCDNKPIDTNAARIFANKLVATLMKNKYSLLILGSIKSRDEYTFVHSINVAIFAIVQAESLGMDQSLLTDIGMAGLLHDTGKVKAEGEILRKKGKLDEDESEKIHMHPADGAKILLETPELSPIVPIAAFEHHISYDLKGYPQKLFGKKISLASMIVAIADVYDAARGRRSYHEAKTPEGVYEEMRSLAGKNFHPYLVDNFFRAIGVYPPGTLVELDDNSIGLVIKENASDIRRPAVEILYNAKGEREKPPRVINLAEKDPATDRYRRNIRRSLPLSEKHSLPSKYNPEK